MTDQAEEARREERERIAALAEKLNVTWHDHERGEDRSFAWLLTEDASA
jgi:hypothetical protein